MVNQLNIIIDGSMKFENPLVTEDCSMKGNIVSDLSNIKSEIELQLIPTIKKLVVGARETIIRSANSELVMLNWSIGRVIKVDIQKYGRADYGEQIVATVSQQLTLDCGRGFTKTAISRMIKFYDLFPDDSIVATLSQQLSWSHIVEILPLEDRLKRDFYIELCCAERWSVRILREKIQGMLFERTALSKKPELTIKNDLEVLRQTGNVTANIVLKDPYVLDFLGLEDAYSEGELEQAILRDLEKFLLELGGDFTFVARQKRISIGHEDFYIDLLFYHRGLNRLILIELKLGKFQASYKG